MQQVTGTSKVPYLDNFQADDTALVENEALAHDIVAPRVAAVLLRGLRMTIINAEDAWPHGPGVVGRTGLRRPVHQL